MADKTYKVVKTDLKKNQHALTLEASTPWDAYHQVADSAYRLIQSDDIGSSDNPCVRFITRDRLTKEKTFFYVQQVLNDAH